MKWRFGPNDDGSRCQMKSGDIFTVELPETPTSGYRWHIEISDGLSLQSVDFAPAGEDLPGAGGVRRWRLCAVRPGECSLQAKLWREWLGEGSVLKRYRLSVQVT